MRWLTSLFDPRPPASNPRKRIRPEAEALEARINPGAGTFANGMFNFSVAVGFDATDAQLATIRDRFQRASQVLADATDGGHRFGEITILNNAGAGAFPRADFLIHPEAGRAATKEGTFGLPGGRVNLYFPSDFQALQGIDGDAYTIAHEFIHHAYGVWDSYAGPAGRAENAPLANDPDGNGDPNSPEDLNYTLMDNFFNRGGRGGSGTTYTLNELSVPSNHDPDGDTGQTYRWGESDWETIAHSRYPLPVPAGLPADAPPPPHTVTFFTVSDASDVALRMM